jgi:ankyrin repeat protein
LHEAVRQGDVAAIASLLASDAALAGARSETDARGTCPLHVAAEFGRPAVVAALLEHGSAPDQRNRHGLTPPGCAVGSAEGRWRRFSDATPDDWQRCADLLRARGAGRVVAPR